MYFIGEDVFREFYPARHLIVPVVTLNHQSLGVHPVTHYVLSPWYSRDVDPLAVQVAAVQITAVDRYPLNAKVALEVTVVPTGTGTVLKAERSLVTLSDFHSSTGVQQVVLHKGLHGVVVVVAGVPDPVVSWQHGEEVVEAQVHREAVKPQQVPVAYISAILNS